jgi:hypothetical protein
LTRRQWFLSLPAIAVCVAAITTYCLIDYPSLVASAGRTPPFFQVWIPVCGLLLLLVPVLWLGSLALPGASSLTALQVHAAVYGALLVVTDFVDSPGHSSPGEAFAAGIWFILVLVLALDVLVAAITWIRLWRSSPGAKAPPFVFLGLTAALLGGWLAGLLIWSTTLPRAVIAAAEAAAGDRPYCIDVQERPARFAGDLSGLSMRAANHAGWYYHFHALLVIGDADRSYMNWSYRTGRFEPVSLSAREGLHLDRIVRCTPTAHFARDWR